MDEYVLTFAAILQELPMDASAQISLFDVNATPLTLSETDVPYSESHGEVPLSSDLSGNKGSRCSPKVISSETGHSIITSSGPKAATHPQRVNLVSRIFNESFGFRPDGKPCRLGPKLMNERLRNTDYLLIAGDEMGYLFGKEMPSSSGRIAWIESMAVRPLYRRQGLASA